MTGQELREKAINGARGCCAWDMLFASEKGMWNNAALELGHEADRMLGVGHQAELQRTVAFIRGKCGALRGDPAHALSDMMLGMLAFGEDLARMLERGEHT